MSGIGFSLSNSTEQAVPAGARRTILQACAPSDQGSILKWWSIAFKNDVGSPLDPGILVRLEWQDDSNGSPSACTPVKNNPNDSTAIRTTGKQTFVNSTQPTPNASAQRFATYVSPSGAYDSPEDAREIPIPAGKKLAITVDAVVANKAVAHMEMGE